MTNDAQWIDPHAAEAQERWPQQFAESQRRLGRLSPDEQSDLFQQGQDITVGLGALLEAGVAIADDEVQTLIGRHYAWVSAFWTPDHDAYVGLGQMYVQDPRFTATYDAVAPGLAQFVCDAIGVWADANLPT